MSAEVAAPLADIVAEARRVLAAAVERDIPLRLLGGLAIALTAPEPRLLPREYKDIDFVTRKGKSPEIGALLEELGYEGNLRFNTMNAQRRLMFLDAGNERQVDVFVGSFSMCHQLPVQERLTVVPDTLPLADLLLTKLQIFTLNEKDQRDALTLLFHHPLGDGDHREINAAWIAELCSRDWGLWRTCTMNLERIRAGLGRYGLTDEQEGLLTARIDELRRRIDAAPKGGKWKLRARVGERMRWYDEPEEVG